MRLSIRLADVGHDDLLGHPLKDARICVGPTKDLPFPEGSKEYSSRISLVFRIVLNGISARISHINSFETIYGFTYHRIS
jgi:hypothetical protein